MTWLAFALLATFLAGYRLGERDASRGRRR